MAENWEHLARVAEELCFYRGCTVDSVNHPTAMYQMNCGNRFGGYPAGGGCNAGHTIGATDELGMEAVADRHHVRDLHVTLLRLLGLDDNKLTFYHASRFKQLSQFGGSAIQKLIA